MINRARMDADRIKARRIAEEVIREWVESGSKRNRAQLIERGVMLALAKQGG